MGKTKSQKQLQTLNTLLVIFYVKSTLIQILNLCEHVVPLYIVSIL